ncbi:putative phosphatidylinositol synthase [Besnoitia besnoiti]|uniref:CDP-diacylglycerol--inositol 3-phosphatidyltransferase n=1 Tax=Besnoitia besnoiti TaxID=94643 RepID=A0A2A9M1A2_BESBE|nr:putative phosphatidylinositol synthase [Besnoitia besnoiti]PFH31749.1 putative phosphatidylinositol synthase [Besnoitia besnoiti]
MASTEDAGRRGVAPAPRRRFERAADENAEQPAHSAASLSPAQRQARERRVFLYIPNIIGYVRLALLVAAAWAWQKAFGFLFVVFYIVSQGLDAVDGAVARRLGQVSVFGACLDQVVDRLSTCLLYILNAVAYPAWAPAFFFALLLDVGGHWVHFFAAAVAGAKSHKQLEDADVNQVLAIYYSSRPVMFAAILGFDGFFLSILLLASPLLEFSSFVFLQKALVAVAYTSAPLMAFKTLTNLLQGVYGAQRLVACGLAAES